MSNYQRRSLSSKNQAEAEAAINSKSADDLRIALLNPLSKASQIQRNLDWNRLEHRVYIMEIIHLAAVQQLQVNERERKAIIDQQIAAQLEKDKDKLNEDWEEYRTKIKEATQEKLSTTTNSTQLTPAELKERIEKFKEEIKVTEKSIEELTKELTTIDRRKEFLIEAWKELKTEQIEQFTADLKEQNIDLHTASGPIKADSPEARDIIKEVLEEILAMPPDKLAENYKGVYARIAKAYENEAKKEGKPIETDPAAIMAAKEMPMPATPEEQNSELKKLNIGLEQVIFMAKLAKGVTGPDLETLTKKNMPALAQWIASGHKAEQTIQDRHAVQAAADTTTPEADKKYKYASNQSAIVETVASLVGQKAEKQSELASEKTKLDAQKTQLAQNEKTYEQQMKESPRPE